MNKSVTIVEVGPRDGLQNVAAFVPTHDKIALIQKLVASGIREIQIGSFVSPQAIPQFADIKELLTGLDGNVMNTALNAMAANRRGMLDAVASGIKNIVFFFSVSESHNRNNVRQSVAESLTILKEIKTVTDNNEVALRVDIATIFGCPFEGFIPIPHIIKCIDDVAALGISEITLCDTVGFANPQLIEDILTSCLHRFPKIVFRLHLHNTRGLALANALRAFDIGIRHFDSAIGGLGGCPFAPGASGNVATEDIAFMFEQMGIETGIDLEKLFMATKFLQEILPSTAISSAVFQAGKPCGK